MTFDDLLNAGSNCNSEDKQITFNIEKKRIEKRVSDYVSQIEDFIFDSMRMISARAEYSEECKKELNKKLKDEVTALPKKIEAALNEIYNSDKEEKIENKDEHKDSEEPKENEIRFNIPVKQSLSPFGEINQPFNY